MAKCGLFYGEYPDSIEFVIFVMGGGWCRKMRFLHNADQDLGHGLKKIFFLECRLCVYSWLQLLTILILSGKLFTKLDMCFMEKFMQ